MFARTLSILAMTAFVSAAAAPQAAAGSCCGGCGYTCASPPQIQIWGLTPSYVVNQGPVYSGPGIYTSPTYEGEVSTADYPYVGYGDYPRPYRPYYGVTYADPYRDHLDRPYWQSGGLLPPRHFEMFQRHTSYRRLLAR
jgi:hypothetical protein